MERTLGLLFAAYLALPLGAMPPDTEVPLSCGEFPKLVPHGYYLDLDDRRRILRVVTKNKKLLWEPIDAKDLGPEIKREMAAAKKTANFIIVFDGSYHPQERAARKKALAQILQRSGLAFSPPECDPPKH